MVGGNVNFVQFAVDDDPDAMARNEKFRGAIPQHRYRKMSEYPVQETAVLVKNLCKGYVENGPLVLNNFNMHVMKGTIYGLLGSSGCGKTTALSCIVGLKEWESGEILVFGKRPGTKGSGIPGKRLGYVPQDIALYDHLSIKENIQYYGRLYGMSEMDILEQWQVLVDLLQLPSEFKLVTNLSGGQRRRTSLALALVHHPSLLILDEPTVGLDPLLRESVWEHLYNLVQTQGSTIIITTHYIEESRHADKIGVMRHGRLLVENCPSILMAQHKTDLLEDVVLKLCWSDTKKGAMRKSQSHHILNDNNNEFNHHHHDSSSAHPNNKDGNGGDTFNDDDSGTGTDNDNIVEADANNHNENQEDEPITFSVSKAGSDSKRDHINASHANLSTLVPTGAKAVHHDKRRMLQRSTSSEFAGALFQSKWKPEIQVLVVGEDSPNVQGKYKQNYGFDSGPISICPGFEGSGGLRYSDFASVRTSHGPKKWVADFLEHSQRVMALCVVIYLSLIRHPLFFLAALVLPAVEVLLTVSSVGKEPKGLRLAVINEEMPDWAIKCPQNYVEKTMITNLNTSLIQATTMMPSDFMGGDYVTGECNFNELSCKYLNLISQEGIVDLMPYGTTEEAVLDVERGKLWGYLHFASNYSQHLIDRLATKQFAFEESINGSTINLRMDMSQYIGSVIVIKHLFDGLQEYIQELIGSCDLGARQAEIPLHYRKPVYGTLEANYHNYLIPGVLANIMFMMPFAISGVVFITDFKLGTLGRAKVAGLTTIEMMVTYTITQGSIVIGQIIVCTLCLKLGFNFEMVGSTLLYIAITLLLGMCGQAFGLLVGIICQDEIEALIVAVFILPFMLLYGGVLWPIDCMAPTWKAFGYVLPTTLISESLRSTAARGVGITHGLMWPGIAVTFGWLVFFWIASLIAYKYLIK